MKKKTLHTLTILASLVLLTSCVHEGASSTPSSMSTSSETTSTAVSSQDSSLGGYYATIDWTQKGSTLRTSLMDLLSAKANKTASTFTYGDSRTHFVKSDPDGKGRIRGFYDGTSIGPSWDKGETWNREHVWPAARSNVARSNSDTGLGGDLHMLRPTATLTNENRGDKFFSATASSTTSDPGDKVASFRGESARIIFYCAVRYWKSKGLELSNNPEDADGLKTMGVASELLAWNTAYPVTDSEITRNEYVATLTGVRNPFIDHPEAALAIWSNLAA